MAGMVLPMVRAMRRAVVGNIASADPFGDISLPYALRIAANATTIFDHKTAQLADVLNFSRSGSATYIDENGDIKTAATDELRYEYQDGKKYILLENSATNLLPYSAVAAENWPIVGAANSDLSLNALGIFPGMLVASNGQTWHRATAGNVIPLTNGVTVFFTVYCRPGTSGMFRVEIRNVSAGTGSTISDFIGGSSPTKTETAGSISIDSDVLLDDGISRKMVVRFTPNFTGNCQSGAGPASAVAGEDIILLGAQIETVAPTSYIPTSGSAVTRAAGIAQSDITALDLSSGFSVFFDGSVIGAGRVFQLGSSTDRITLQWDGTNAIFDVYFGGVLQASYTSSGVVAGVDFKFSARITSNDINVAFNGVTAIPDTSANYSEPQALYIAASNNATADKPVRLFISDLRIYDAPLTDAELAEVTS